MGNEYDLTNVITVILFDIFEIFFMNGWRVVFKLKINIFTVIKHIFCNLKIATSLVNLNFRNIFGRLLCRHAFNF